MSGYAWSPKVSAAYDRWLDPPDDDEGEVIEPSECLSCAAPVCTFCDGCSEEERELCASAGCTCPRGPRLLPRSMSDEAYERAVDDAIDDVRSREDDA